MKFKRRIAIMLEELAAFVISVYALYYFQQAWWVCLLLLLAAGISMAGYLAGNTIGAFSPVDHKGIAILFFQAGIILTNQILLIAGFILFGHSSPDRILGFGLKYKEGFFLLIWEKLESSVIWVK